MMSRYLLAILCPPLAVLQTRGPRLFYINILFTLCLFVPGIIHALVMVHTAPPNFPDFPDQHS